MKKKRLAGLLLLAPVTLLAGCGGMTALSITPNWYADNTLVENRTDEKEEVLEYKVTFTAPTEAADFSVSYDEGVYKTSLRSERRTLANGTDETVYVYSTSLSISGRYSYLDQTSETFTDTVTSEAVFRNVKYRLQPISSLKTVTCTAPLKMAPTALEGSFETYRYSYETTYDAELTKATAVYTDFTAETPTPQTTEIELDDSGTYFDNEQMLFALRGVNLASIISFRSVNPVVNQEQTLTTSEPTATSVVLRNVTINGTESAELSIDAYKVGLAYQTTLSGGTQTLYYAQSKSPNTYRNALLYMESPVMYGLGTLCYTLTNASFTDK